MSDAQMAEVARRATATPTSVRDAVAGADEIETGDTVELIVELEREMEDGELGPVLAPRFGR